MKNRGKVWMCENLYIFVAEEFQLKKRVIRSILELIH